MLTLGSEVLQCVLYHLVLGRDGSRRGGSCRSRSRREVDRRRLGRLEASKPCRSLRMMMGRRRMGGLGLDWSWLEACPGVGLGRALLLDCTAEERLGDGRGGVGDGLRHGLGHHGRRVVPAGPVGDCRSEAWPGLVRLVLRGGRWSQGGGRSSGVWSEEVRL